MKLKIKKNAGNLFLIILAFVTVLPVFIVLSASIKSEYELENLLEPIFFGGGEYLEYRFFPSQPTAMHFVRLLFLNSGFFKLFWNSVKIVCGILAGQLLIAVPAAWAFAAMEFPAKRFLLSFYIILMLMPFQVTMLPRYLMLDKLGILDMHAAIILPEVFSTFPVFLIYRGFRTIPQGIMEAAKVDGAGRISIFFRIGIPLGSPGIFSAIVLGFLEYWNLIEQPLAYLKTRSLWPLSLYLPQVEGKRVGEAFAIAVIILLPAIFMFFAGQDYLEQGITQSALKE